MNNHPRIYQQMLKIDGRSDLGARAAHDREMDENIGSLTPLGLPSGIIFDTCFSKFGIIFQQLGDRFSMDFRGLFL